MPTNSQLLIYQTPDGNIKIDVRLEDETVWLTQKLMAELFQVKPQNITMHLKNIYDEGELVKDVTCKEFLQVESREELRRCLQNRNSGVFLTTIQKFTENFKLLTSH
ncbi:MAG: hypothetical protein HQK77_05975 [Desulfobacterales bacterium]|nr:hypothetical protein [Desulfobacterales bacterium]